MRQKKRLIFLGCRELGYRALEWLIQADIFEIVGACLYPNDGDRYWDKDPRDLCETLNIKEYDINELSSVEFDLGLSVNYHKLIREDILNLAPDGIWNVHHAYNLRLKGRNTITHAILNSSRDNIYYHGTTLHKMVNKLDVGPIVASRAIEIGKDDTAYSLFCKLDDMALEVLKEWVPRIAYESVFLYEPPTEGVQSFKAVDMPERIIDLEAGTDFIRDFVRAFDFPGFAPAYFMKNDKKIEVVLHSRDGYSVPISIKGIEYYTNIAVN